MSRSNTDKGASGSDGSREQGADAAGTGIGGEPEWDGWATVRVESYLYIQHKYAAPHPDMIDTEAVEVALAKRIEEAGGVVSGLEGISLEHCTLNVEVESWHREQPGPPQARSAPNQSEATR